ncbi:hypothetical protein, partial [Massilia genomosp. 1]|uniref:hypothetical protein n=1 Tax=Massilia genomosp. 1 TaxID=2609280 RepID=UPI001C9E59B0
NRSNRTIKNSAVAGAVKTLKSLGVGPSFYVKTGPSTRVITLSNEEVMLQRGICLSAACKN